MSSLPKIYILPYSLVKVNHVSIKQVERGILIKFADELGIGVRELLDFGHEARLYKLKETMNRFLKGLDE